MMNNKVILIVGMTYKLPTFNTFPTVPYTKSYKLKSQFQWSKIELYVDSRLVRGTPTAGVLLHWVIISRRWERIQARDSELPINTDSPRKKKCCDAVA